MNRPATLILKAPCPECGGGYLQDYIASGPQLIQHENSCDTYNAILNALADRITFGVLLACVAELGPTRRAVAAAFAAVVLTDAIAFEEGGNNAQPDQARPRIPCPDTAAAERHADQPGLSHLPGPGR